MFTRDGVVDEGEGGTDGFEERDTEEEVDGNIDTHGDGDGGSRSIACKVWGLENDNGRKFGNDAFVFVAGDNTREENRRVLVMFRCEDVHDELWITLDDTKDKDG